MSEVKRDIRSPLLFECAWEVANKVGGIYTVIKTKVPVTVSEFGDRYTLIGPLSYKTAPMEVEAQEPQDPHLAATLDNMRAAGVKMLYGRWLIEGAPNVLLFDTGSQYSRLDEWKGDLWNLAGIPTPPNDHETNETIVFGYIVAWFLGEARMASAKPSSASQRNPCTVLATFLPDHLLIAARGLRFRRTHASGVARHFGEASLKSSANKKYLGARYASGTGGHLPGLELLHWLPPFSNTYTPAAYLYVARQLDKAVIAHFHEWQAGLAIPLCRKRHIDVTTVFTTHATLLGRYLCAGSVDFYNNLQYFDVDHEAGKRGIYHRYCIERSAAHCADVFTTVSHITAYESEHLLKRKPDGVLPNGLNVVKFQAMHEFQNLHSTAKAKINDFIRGHFYGHYDFDLDNTLYMFTAGRYEYRNKGVDMFIEALARMASRYDLYGTNSDLGISGLNYRLKKSGSKVTVIAFIIMPAATHSYTIDALKGQAVTKQLRDTVTEIQNRVGVRLFEHAMSSNGEHGTLPTPDDLLSDEDKVLLKRRIFALKRNMLPPVTTHNMADDANDPILNQIRRVQLFNHSSDRVKIVFHPDFLNSNNPILGLDYEEFVRGCHLGVFPSYYEPWGYTPAECTVMGIPSVTTNLSGFGCFIQDLIERPQDEGIYIVDRRSQSVEDSVNQLTDYMFSFTQKTRRQRINQRNRVERLSPLLDWKNLGIEYSKARQLALRRAYPDAFYGPGGEGEEEELDFGMERMTLPISVPASPRFRMSGIATPGDIGTLTEEMQALRTSDYRGFNWPGSQDDEDEGYPFPLVMKVRSRANSVMSGASTPGGGRSKSLSEGDLRKADAALSNVNEAQSYGVNGVNGH
ncbi:glycogen synthase [Trametes punicea]|nr:glycogen synthase [Trametes punicea]